MTTSLRSSTRDKLLAEAIRIFAKQGYRKTIVREICDAASIGQCQQHQLIENRLEKTFRIGQVC